MMQVMSREAAEKEFATWLEYKKISDRKRENYKDSIDTLVDAMMDGLLVVDKEFNLVQTLKFPIKNEVETNVLEYKPRLKVGTVHQHLQSIKATDADGRICAYIAALTSKPKELIKSMETDDYAIGQAIAIFFL